MMLEVVVATIDAEVDEIDEPHAMKLQRSFRKLLSVSTELLVL
jgi:hypothetical protein